MKKADLTIFTLAIFLFVSCTVKPEKISYGGDACAFCKMTIVDQQHAAQYVTKKGKQFKFDAVECMLNDISEKNTGDISVFMVSDYGNPGQMTDAKTATFLISQEIKSPMGAFLSAFSSEEKANATQIKNSGNLYNWISIKEKFAVK